MICNELHVHPRPLYPLVPAMLLLSIRNDMVKADACRPLFLHVPPVTVPLPHPVSVEMLCQGGVQPYPTSQPAHMPWEHGEHAVPSAEPGEKKGCHGVKKQLKTAKEEKSIEGL